VTAQPPDLFAEILESRAPRGYGGLFYGAYPGVVRDNQDPDGEGKVKVALPWSPDPESATFEAWARLSAMMAGNNRGTWFIPDVDDEVLVVFLAGNPRWPCVVGSLWNGRDQPPQSMDQQNNKKVIRSRNGVKITIDDQSGQETLTLETPAGQTVTLKDGPGSIELRDSNGNNIKLEASGVTVQASAKITLQAGASIDMTAGIVNINSGMVKCSGVTKTLANLTNATISSLYTPGAGNFL
jgi:uncharacterized protein involved in type VI secretion and phage assembly